MNEFLSIGYKQTEYDSLLLDEIIHTRFKRKRKEKYNVVKISKRIKNNIEYPIKNDLCIRLITKHGINIRNSFKVNEIEEAELFLLSLIQLDYIQSSNINTLTFNEVVEVCDIYGCNKVVEKIIKYWYNEPRLPTFILKITNTIKLKLLTNEDVDKENFFFTNPTINFFEIEHIKSQLMESDYLISI